MEQLTHQVGKIVQARPPASCLINIYLNHVFVAHLFIIVKIWYTFFWASQLLQSVFALLLDVEITQKTNQKCPCWCSQILTSSADAVFWSVILSDLICASFHRICNWKEMTTFCGKFNYLSHLNEHLWIKLLKGYIISISCNGYQLNGGDSID